MYDSIEDLPCTRFQIYNFNVMLDSGIGGDIQAFDDRCNNIRRLIQKDIAQADKEILNLQQNLRFIMSNTNPTMRSFVAMIHKINGQHLTESDLTEAGIDKIIDRLGKRRLPMRKVFSFLLDLKKKLKSSSTPFSLN